MTKKKEKTWRMGHPTTLVVVSLATGLILLGGLGTELVRTGQSEIVLSRTQKDLSSANADHTQVLTMDEQHAAERFATLTLEEEELIVSGASMSASNLTEPKNIFFLKTSKTGSTTMMSIVQRYGLKHNMSFLLGENNGGMAHNERPLNLEDDCWIGKNSETQKKFNISTNHIHYNRTAVDALMAAPYHRVTILRDPETQFVSSFKFYHDLFPKLAMKLNPNADYNQKRRETRDLKYKPGQDDILFEMEKFLDNPWTYIRNFTPRDWSWMALVRPQLLFFGKSPANIASYDRTGLSRPHALEWIKEIVGEFNNILILEHFELSLAVLSIELGIPPVDLVYVAVNQQNANLNSSNLTPEAKLQLRRLNWPDFLLYQAANATLWSKISHYGQEHVQMVADEIKQISDHQSQECLEFPTENDSKISRPTVKAEQVESAACKRLNFQGTHTTKLFQVNQINQILQTQPDYKFCTNKIVYGMTFDEFKNKRKTLLRKFKTLRHY